MAYGGMGGGTPLYLVHGVTQGAGVGAAPAAAGKGVPLRSAAYDLAAVAGGPGAGAEPQAPRSR